MLKFQSKLFYLYRKQKELGLKSEDKDKRMDVKLLEENLSNFTNKILTS